MCNAVLKAVCSTLLNAKQTRKKKANKQAIEQERNHPISYTETKKRQNNGKENYKGLKSSSSEE